MRSAPRVATAGPLLESSLSAAPGQISAVTDRHVEVKPTGPGPCGGSKIQTLAGFLLAYELHIPIIAPCPFASRAGLHSGRRVPQRRQRPRSGSAASIELEQQLASTISSTLPSSSPSCLESQARRRVKSTPAQSESPSCVARRGAALLIVCSLSQMRPDLYTSAPHPSYNHSFIP